MEPFFILLLVASLFNFSLSDLIELSNLNL